MLRVQPDGKAEVCAALEHTRRVRNELGKQMTPAWRMILNAVQANVRGAAYITDLSITQDTFAEADAEKGKNCDGDVTPAGSVSTGPSWKKGSNPLALLPRPLNMFGAERRH